MVKILKARTLMSPSTDGKNSKKLELICYQVQMVKILKIRTLMPPSTDGKNSES